MQMAGIQYAVSILFPLALAGCVWVACHRPIRLAWSALALFLGALSVFPAIRVGNFVEPRVQDWAGHFYANELVSQFLTTALPEEWGMGLATVLVWLLMRKPNNPLAWVSCAAASHCGFAILEGLFGTFANEGILKVIVGRSLGATEHCSWGIIAAWFAYRGWRGWRFRTLSWTFALLIPSVLHSVSNAAAMEIPGDAASDAGSAISATEFMVVFPGMASLPCSWAVAVWCVYAARNASSLHPIAPDV